MLDHEKDILELTFQIDSQKVRELSEAEKKAERARCAKDLVYFVRKYCKIYDNDKKEWIAFDLWPSQVELLKVVAGSKYTLIPKARQLGITWLLGDVRPLWGMLFHPVREVLIFSQRDDEAMNLLERLKGTFERLPDWLKPGVDASSAHEFKLANGSRVQALPSTAGGRSNAATDVIVDEADFIANLKTLITAAKPTIDVGDNQMVVLSTINEDTPNSYFQRLVKANMNNDAGWKLHFLGWRAHPGRTDAWYAQQRETCLIDNGTLDPIYKEYPETLEQALAPRELNKRFPPDWIMALSAARKPLPDLPGMPAIPGLKIYKTPQPGRKYGVGFDPGGGKVDPSVAIVVDADSKEMMAVLAGLVEATEAANQVTELSLYYGKAPILFELNNHGHAALAQFKERSANLRYGVGKRGQKDREPGWLTTERTKHMLFDVGAIVMQTAVALGTMGDREPEPILFDGTTIAELTSIDVSTLEAPEGMHDDHAMAWVLAQMSVYKENPGVQQTPYTGLWHRRGEGGGRERYLEVPYAGPGSNTAAAQTTPPMPPLDDAPVPCRPLTHAEAESLPVPQHIQERFGRFRR